MFKTLFVLVALFAANAVSAQTITVSNRTVNNTYQPQFPGAAAYYVLANSGDIITATPNTTNGQDVGDWLTPKSGMAGFQVRPTANTCGGPTVGVWYPLSGSVYWVAQPSGPSPQSRSCSFSYEISAIANPSVILGAATVWLNAWY
jgi:hypothetical protein